MNRSASKPLAGISLGLGLLVGLLIGCGGAQGDVPAAAASGADQVAIGAKLYGQHCADCHGANGEGTKGAPAVVGKTALPLDPPAGAKHRKGQFHTAKDVFDFVKANMPANKPGSLTDEQYLAILAFDLNANGVAMAGKKLDAGNAASFVIH